MKLSFFFTLFLILSLASPAMAMERIDFEKRMEQCSEITARVERVICYDHLAEDMGYVAADHVEREEDIIDTYGFWIVAKRRNAAGEDVIYLKNDSVEHVVSKSGMRRKPTLVIKCKHGETDLYIDWKVSMSPLGFDVRKQDVVYQFGAGQSYSEIWEISTDKHAVFSPEPIQFVKEMIQYDKVIFQISPYHDLSQTIVHDISGLDTVIKILVDQCYK